MEARNRGFFGALRNNSIGIYYGVRGLFVSDRKIDEMNERSLEGVRRGEELTVLLHGTANRRSTYGAIRMLEKEGVDVVSLGYDYKQAVEKSSKEIGEMIDDLMDKEDVKRINIIGICLGGLVARYYAEVLGGKKYIDKLVTIYTPLKTIPSTEIGYKLNQLIGGEPEIYNRALEKIEGVNSVKKHLFIYSCDDGIIRPRYGVYEGFNQVCLRGGHLLVSYNPESLKIAAEFVKG